MFGSDSREAGVMEKLGAFIKVLIQNKCFESNFEQSFKSIGELGAPV